MIVRILHEGQFEVDDEGVKLLNELDDQLVASIEAGDEDHFRSLLTQILDRVRQAPAVPDERLVPSELVLPDADASIHEVRDLLESDGLVPG